MIEIRDCRGSLVCKGDAASGLVEHLYQHCKVRMHLAIDACIVIERDGITTKITRINAQSFHVISRVSAA